MANPEQLKNRELVSALADGQLRAGEFAQAVKLANEDADALAAWHAYHLVGDVLRSGEAGFDFSRPGFLARFESRLELESDSSGVLGDGHFAIDLEADDGHSMRARGLNSRVTASANDASFRWKLLTAVASLAAVAAIGWNTLGFVADPAGGLGGSGRGAQIAQTPGGAASPAGVAVTPEQPPVMIRDPHLDALMAAHNQFGGTSALQMPAGFIRNATFEGAGR